MSRPHVLMIVACFVTLLASRPTYALRVVHEQVILDEIDDYNMCQGRDYSGEFCHDALKRWVKDHPNDAFKAGKLTRLKMNHWVAIPFFAQAFEQKKGDCKDEDVKLAVVSAIDLPASSQPAIVQQAKKIGIQTCFNELKETMVSAASIGSYAFTNICKDLVSKNALSGLKAKKCAETK